MAILSKKKKKKTELERVLFFGFYAVFKAN